MGHIDVAIRALAAKLDLDLVKTPPTTQRTLSLGIKHSPETVCLPFKLQLGNMIEALEQGADTLIMPGGAGPCRFGYYHKTHILILRELGYEFQMLTQDNGILEMIKPIANGASLREILAAVRFGLAKLKAVEDLERTAHKMRAIERDRGEATRIYRHGIKVIDEAPDQRALKEAQQDYKQKFDNMPTVIPPVPLKVGVIGEFFVVIDPFANMDIEMELGKLGVEVRRTIFAGDWVRINPFHYFFGLGEKSKAHRAAKPYSFHHLGGDGWQSVGEKVMHARDWDGIVHLEPFGCLPEITARNIMPSTKEKLPVLNIIYDEHTAKTGIVTRLEAFVDILRYEKLARARRNNGGGSTS
jgi:predicted nucleotide-binding protein (sugar kinase/HSP70/actin superfamily)